MLRRQREISSQVHMLADATLFALGFYLAHWLRRNWPLAGLWRPEPILPFVDYAWLFIIVIPFGPLLLRFQGFYNRPSLASRRLAAWHVLKGCAYAVVGVILVMWVLREGATIARSVVILFGVMSFVVILLKEELLRLWRRSKLGQEQSVKRLLLVGTPDETARLQAELLTAQSDNLAVVARLDLNETPLEELVNLLHEHSANGLILAAKHTYFGHIERTIELCEREGVEVWLMADFFKTRISQTTVDDFYGRPMLVFRSGPAGSWQTFAKQLLDFVGALVLSVLFCIPLAMVAVAIRLSSPGPVFFRQQRSGLNGRPFTMLKFRSMVTDAEQRKHELEQLNEMSGPVFKVTDDPRVTRLGRWLRRYSVDEWPQLLNVLRGEMSLVGPRPLPVDEVKRFDDPAHRRRLSVKPGLTCLWQVSGRSNVRDFKEWVRLDLEYIDHWSLWLDLTILLRTVPVVLAGSGAK